MNTANKIIAILKELKDNGENNSLKEWYEQKKEHIAQTIREISPEGPGKYDIEVHIDRISDDVDKLANDAYELVHENKIPAITDVLVFSQHKITGIGMTILADNYSEAAEYARKFAELLSFDIKNIIIYYNGE